MFPKFAIKAICCGSNGDRINISLYCLYSYMAEMAELLPLPAPRALLEQLTKQQIQDILNEVAQQGQDLNETLKQFTLSFREKAIIPLLESDPTNFEMKFDEALKYFSHYMEQVIILVKSIQWGNPNTLSLETLSDELEKIPVKVSESSLSKLSDFKNTFLKMGNNPIAISTIVDAISTIEDYVLLSNDPEIDTSKPKYNQAIMAYSNIWTSITALYEILLRENPEDYKNLTDLLIKKCQDSTKELRDYVMMVASDHRRKLTPMMIEALDDIDSGKVKMVTQSADEFLKQMEEELAEK